MPPLIVQVGLHLKGVMMAHVTSPSQTAFLLLDVQRTNARFFAADGCFLGGDPAFLDHVEQALATARRTGLRVIYVGFCLRFGSPTMHPYNRLMNAPRLSRITPHPPIRRFTPAWPTAVTR